MATHPIFEKCVDCTDDPFWKAVFQKAAKGKFHKNVWYSERDGTLVFQTITGNRSVKRHLSLETLSPEDAASQIIKAHQDILSYLSPLDMESRRDELKSIQDTHEKKVVVEWKDITTRIMREGMITNYVMKKGQGWPKKQRKKCIKDILLYISLGFIQNEHIHIDNSIVSGIDNIDITPSGRVVLQLAECKDPTTSKKVSDVVVCPLEKLYEQYLDSL